VICYQPRFAIFVSVDQPGANDFGLRWQAIDLLLRQLLDGIETLLGSPLLLHGNVKKSSVRRIKLPDVDLAFGRFAGHVGELSVEVVVQVHSVAIILDHNVIIIIIA